jgi:cytosine/adenosine deaminase-related metal-dependent hydrolase
MGGKYVIKNATVVSVDSNIGNPRNCDVLIENGIIAAVGPNLTHSPECQIIDGSDSIVSPGFVDTHRHTWQTQLRTIATDYVLSDYLLDLRNIYGASYTAQDAYIGNLCGALESIDNGITALIDHSHIMNSPEHADAAVRGLQDAKIRAVFCYALYKNPAWEGSCLDQNREKTTPDWRLEDARRVKETLFPDNGPEELVRFGFAPSEPDLTPIEQLEQEIRYAREIGAALITAHISYGKWDSGRRITRQLGERGVLGPDMVLSHANTLLDEELAAVKKNGVGLSTTPDTELQMGMSHPIAFRAKDTGCIASLGVDVCCSTPGYVSLISVFQCITICRLTSNKERFSFRDIFQQMRLLIQTQRHLEHERQPGPPLNMSRPCADVLEMATLGGAKALGLQDLIGSITPGKRADILITRCNSTRLFPVHDPVGALVLYANGSDVDTVFVNGEMVKSGGKLVHVDWLKVREELRASVVSVMERSKKAPSEFVQAGKQYWVDLLTGTKEPDKKQ